jgi:hypothetical protein
MMLYRKFGQISSRVPVTESKMLILISDVVFSNRVRPDVVYDTRMRLLLDEVCRPDRHMLPDVVVALRSPQFKGDRPFNWEVTVDL